MSFKMDIEQVYASESYMLAFDNQLEDKTNEWEQIYLPYPAHLDKRKAMYNLTMIKSMLNRMELKNGVDYIFCTPHKDIDKRTNVYLRFRTPGEGLMATMRWLGSDWYRKSQ